MSDAIRKGSWVFPTSVIILLADVLTAKVYVSNLSKCWVFIRVPSDISALGTFPYRVRIGDMERIYAAVISVCSTVAVISSHV